jgi:hypothetical protein
MKNISDIADEFLKEAAHDYIGLWAISGAVRWGLELSDNAQVKARTLDVVRILLAHGLLAGDFDYGNSKLYFWNERDADSVVARIDREWDPAHGDPSLPESICWLGFKGSERAPE